MRMVVLLPAGVATREVLSPLEVIHERLAPEVTWAGVERGPVPGHDPPMSFHADEAIGDLTDPPELLLLPGGFGSLELALDGQFVDNLRRLISPATVCLAISTGSLALAATGLLDGQRVSGHWLSRSHLLRYGSIPVTDPFVAAGRLITASGSVSATFAARFAADLVAFGPQSEMRGRSVGLGQGA